MTVTLLDKRVFKAKVVGRDPTTDVAVIKIDGQRTSRRSRSATTPRRASGEWVLAIGNPLGLDFTVTAGIVSAKGRRRSELLNPYGRTRTRSPTTSRRTRRSTPATPAVRCVNIRGEVIGINSAIASGTGYYAGYGFAIPITLAKQVMDDLIKYGKVRRADRRRRRSAK